MTELSTSELNELRDRYIRLTVEPTIRWVFAKFPHIRSVTIRVAQYWDDEANDAVHGDLVFSELETPSLNQKDDPNFTVAPVLERKAPWDGWKYCNLDTGEFNHDVDGWSDNWIAIPLFAAWCAEDMTQEMGRDEAYSPYATYRKTDAGVQRELYPMVREYCDGVEPERTDGVHNVFAELRKLVAHVPPSIIGENIPLGPLTDEVRRQIDVCGHLKSYTTFDYGATGGKSIIKHYNCTTLRMHAGKCDQKGCPFKEKEP